MFRKRKINPLKKPLTVGEAMFMSKSILTDFKNVVKVLKELANISGGRGMIVEDLINQNRNLKLILKSLISLELNSKTNKELNKKIKITDKESYKASELYGLMLEVLA